ncbi:MAG: tripartite tricarboxylate transporter substrate binding protein [Burkholderiales bacterium]|nr:tripartite tricarboxylate transporter substrate binding protein [Burkholderiales bacterium]
MRFIIPAAAGGIHDTVGRLLAQKVAELWGHPVVIDNRPGAGGIIATEAGAKAPADGYTWLMNISAFTTNPHLYRNLPYDTERDFVPVTQLVSFPLILVAHPSLSVRSVKEFIALARARSGELNYASPGVGTSPHLAMELFRTMAGIRLTHVPYKGGPLGTTAILSGEVSVYFNSIITPLPHIRGGRLRALGVSGPKRSQVVPEVPTIMESGLPGYEVIGWLGLLMPAAVAPGIVLKVHADVARALQAPEVRSRISAEGVEPVGSSPQAFGTFLASEIRKWGRVVRDAGLRQQ